MHVIFDGPIHAMYAIAALTLLAMCATVSAAPAGKVVASRGAVTIQPAEGAARLVGRGDPIAVGDVLTTGKKSFSILEFNDGTRMSLRPNTVFKVEQWSVEAEQESAVTRLFKGGLRAVTGFITRRNSNAFRVNTPVATIGIRGTTFDARLCEGDCAADVRASAGGTIQRSQAIGRVAFVKGTANARKKDSDYLRPVEAGSPLYEGDTVSTPQHAYAVLIFKDRSRVTLRANTVFAIEELKYAEDRAEEDSSVMRLVRGGLRAVTGLIGKRNAGRVRYRTTVATIGIRGTGFDLICIDACGADGSSTGWNLRDLVVPDAYAADGLPAGLLVTAWLKDIFAEINGKQFNIPEDKVFFIPLSALIPQELPQMPFEIDEPRPHEVELDEADLFDYGQAPEGADGLHVACLEGTACAVGDEILAAGESVYTSEDGTTVIRTEYAAGFLVNDKYFKTINVPPEVLDLLYDVDAAEGAVGECTAG
jgi:hypothetical protein